MEDTATILYVEDNTDNRILILRILNAEGYQVLFAEDAEQALETAQQESIDLILMDIHLPEKDGFTATREIKAITKDVVVIAQTAYAFSVDHEEAQKAGCDAFLTKPLSAPLLLEKINGYLT